MWKCKNNLSLKVKKYNQLKELPFHRERGSVSVNQCILLLLCNACNASARIYVRNYNVQTAHLPSEIRIGLLKCA